MRGMGFAINSFYIKNIQTFKPNCEKEGFVLTNSKCQTIILMSDNYR